MNALHSMDFKKGNTRSSWMKTWTGLKSTVPSFELSDSLSNAQAFDICTEFGNIDLLYYARRYHRRKYQLEDLFYDGRVYQSDQPWTRNGKDGLERSPY
jgi:hypothetical protein